MNDEVSAPKSSYEALLAAITAIRSREAVEIMLTIQDLRSPSFLEFHDVLSAIGVPEAHKLYIVARLPPDDDPATTITRVIDEVRDFSFSEADNLIFYECTCHATRHKFSTSDLEGILDLIQFFEGHLPRIQLCRAMTPRLIWDEKGSPCSEDLIHSLPGPAMRRLQDPSRIEHILTQWEREGKISSDERGCISLTACARPLIRCLEVSNAATELICQISYTHHFFFDKVRLQSFLIPLRHLVYKLGRSTASIKATRNAFIRVCISAIYIEDNINYRKQFFSTTEILLRNTTYPDAATIAYFDTIALRYFYREVLNRFTNTSDVRLLKLLVEATKVNASKLALGGDFAQARKMTERAVLAILAHECSAFQSRLLFWFRVFEVSFYRFIGDYAMSELLSHAILQDRRTNSTHRRIMFKNCLEACIAQRKSAEAHHMINLLPKMANLYRAELYLAEGKFHDASFELQVLLSSQESLTQRDQARYDSARAQVEHMQARYDHALTFWIRLLRSGYYAETSDVFAIIKFSIAAAYKAKGDPKETQRFVDQANKVRSNTQQHMRYLYYMVGEAWLRIVWSQLSNDFDNKPCSDMSFDTAEMELSTEGMDQDAEGDPDE